MAAPAFIELDGLSKAYAGVQALAGVGLSIVPGAALCLAGENGSGKSTLIKILSGVERADEGRVLVDGRPLAPNPRAAAAAGVQVIFQDFSLFPNLSVAENIAFSHELGERRRLFDRRRVRSIAERALARVGVAIDPEARVETLPVAHKQLVAICRALVAEARLVVMDEPTTALTEREVRTLLDIIRRLKAEGVAVLFVSHKLAEVLEVCEHVVVLRNGRKVAEGPASDFDAALLTRHMTGRDVKPAAPDPLGAGAPVLLRVEGLGRAGAFEDVSLTVSAGEVVGVAGLLGSGRTALAKALFGLVKPERGRIALDGRDLPLGDPIAAAAAGIGYVPEDRLTEGLFLAQSIRRNIGVGRLDAHRRGGRLDLPGLWSEATDWLARLRVAAPDAEAPVRSLSGGNQQRVVLARWLARGPKVLVLNGPTVGVDVGSKADIHAVVADLARQGLGVLVISDDLPELLETCHRILVMKAGRIVEAIAAAEADEAGLARRLAS